MPFYITYESLEAAFDDIIDNCDYYAVTTSAILDSDGYPDYSLVAAASVVGPAAVVAGDWTKDIDDDMDTVGTLTKDAITGATITATGTGKYLCLLDSTNSLVKGVILLEEELDIDIAAVTINLPAFSIYVGENSHGDGAFYFDSGVMDALLDYADNYKYGNQASFLSSGGMPPTYSAAFASNPIFADAPDGFAYSNDLAWDKAYGWSIASEKASCDGTQTTSIDLLQKVGDLENLESYLVIIKASGMTAGTITPYVGGTKGSFLDFNDTFGQYITTRYSTDVRLRADSYFDGDIESCSLYKGSELLVNGAFCSTYPWSLSEGWSITGGAAVPADGLTLYYPLEQEISDTTAPSGYVYRAAFDLSGITSGYLSFKWEDSGGSGTTPINSASSAGSYSNYFMPSNAPAKVIISPTAPYDASIDNVSLERGTQLVTNGFFTTGDMTGWSAENDAGLNSASGWGIVYYTSTANPTAAQSITVEVGKQYRIGGTCRAYADNWTIEVRDGTSPSGTVLATDTNSGDGSWHDVDETFVATSTTVTVRLIFATSSSGSAYFDEISLYSIDDADELVINGGFAGVSTGWTAGAGATLSVDTTNHNLDITNGSTDYGYACQEIETEIGTLYGILFDFEKTTSDLRIRVGTSAGASDIELETVTATATGTLITFTATGTSTFISFGPDDNTSGNVVTVDNIFTILPAGAADAGQLLENNSFDDVSFNRQLRAICDGWDAFSVSSGGDYDAVYSCLGYSYMQDGVTRNPTLITGASGQTIRAAGSGYNTYTTSAGIRVNIHV